MKGGDWFGKNLSLIQDDSDIIRYHGRRYSKIALGALALALKGGSRRLDAMLGIRKFKQDTREKGTVK